MATRYFKQLCMWLAIVTAMKLLVVGLMNLFAHQLEAVAKWIPHPVQKPWSKLLIVMILLPLIMNALQLWVVDNFIKGQGACEESSTEDGEGEREHLMSPEAASQ